MSLISTNEEIGERSQGTEVEDRLWADLGSNSEAEAVADFPGEESADGISDTRLYLAAMTYFFSKGE